MSVADDLVKYKELYDQGILTEDEFIQKKKELLDPSYVSPSNKYRGNTSSGQSQPSIGVKGTSILGYIGLLFWLIAYLVGDREGAKFHLNQSLVLNIAILVCSCIPVIGWIADILFLVLWIMGIVNAIQEEEKELPIIGKIMLLK